MKKNLLKTVTALLFFSSISFAQPILTATGINPVPGDAFTISECNYISPGSAGTNQTWDLSTLVTNTTTNVSYISISSTPYASTFSSIATVCRHYSTGPYFYYNGSSSAFQNVGSAFSGPPACTEILPTPEDVLRFPFNYTNSYTDYDNTTNCTVTSSTRTVTYDGYGTLILPTGTFSNVIRIHNIATHIMTAPFSVTEYYDYYDWYINGTHYPLASVVNSTINTTSNQYSRYIGLTTTNINEINNYQLTFELYPNPANDKINFNLDNITLLNQIDIYDVTGKLCYSALVDVNELINNTYFVNIKNFKNGMYFSKLTMKNGSIITKKFTVFTGS